VKKRALILVAAAIVFALVGTGAGPAQAQDNTAIAINTKDGTDIFKLAFKIARVNQDIVDQSNGAVAFNSCEQCQAIAIAFQVVLIFSDPAVVSSQNLAIAINYECDACVAFASAYQWLLTTGGPVHFTAEGNERLAEVRKRLHDLANSNLSIEQLQAELDEIKNDLADILATELVPAGQGGGAVLAPVPATTTGEPTTTGESATSGESATTGQSATTGEPATTIAPTTTQGPTSTTP
jgi:putative peptide zinc metalloprotease protein